MVPAASAEAAPAAALMAPHQSHTRTDGASSLGRTHGANSLNRTDGIVVAALSLTSALLRLGQVVSTIPLTAPGMGDPSESMRFPQLSFQSAYTMDLTNYWAVVLILFIILVILLVIHFGVKVWVHPLIVHPSSGPPRPVWSGPGPGPPLDCPPLVRTLNIVLLLALIRSAYFTHSISWLSLVPHSESAVADTTGTNWCLVQSTGLGTSAQYYALFSGHHLTVDSQLK